MGQIFPFEVAKIPKRDLSYYGEFVPIFDPNIPNDLQVYVDAEIVNELTDPFILDYTDLGDVGLAFSPPIPLPMEQYQFYNPNDTKIKN